MLLPIVTHPADRDECREYLSKLSDAFEDEKLRCEAGGDRHGVKVSFVRLNLLREIRERLLGK